MELFFFTVSLSHFVCENLQVFSDLVLQQQQVSGFLKLKHSLCMLCLNICKVSAGIFQLPIRREEVQAYPALLLHPEGLQFKEKKENEN